MKKGAAVFAVVFGLLCALLLPGLGWRPLWQDEVETAERGRAIVSTGLPKVTDPFGRVSLNAGGREIEDGDLHRFTPWGMFYWAAGGLVLGDALGLERDFSARLPSALAHAGAAASLGAGAAAFGGAHPALAAGLGLAYGLGSVRLLHGRTARYHALMDFLAALGLLLLAAYRTGRRAAVWPLAALCFLLPHAHTIGGVVIGASLVAWAWILGGRRAAGPAAAGLVAGFALLLVQTRPWANAWSSWIVPEFEGLRDLQGVAFPLAVWVWTARRAAKAGRVEGLEALVGLGAALAPLLVFECNEQSQPRYYFALSAPAFFWALALGRPAAGHWKAVGAALVAAELFVGLLPSPEHDPTLKHSHLPLQGARVALFDAARAREGREVAPYREAFALVSAAPGEGAVLSDYVPQFVNWYLPGRPVALMPDLSERLPRNAANPVWDREPPFPEWHLWHPRYGGGAWTCRPHCDFREENWDERRGRYDLVSGRLSRREPMCVVKSWMTHHWNGAPFMNLRGGAFRAAGEPHGPLVLARPCASLK